ncbi:MAG: acylphosphatase [Kiritimatiellaeota bacterium]|nr:acylphosphatase [Kiritimatiellota bacterium]
MEISACRVRVQGRVTGVGFRFSALREAGRIGGLAGYVRNVDPRTVECVVQGDPERVAAMAAWLHRGPPSAVVLNVQVNDLPVSPDLPPFRIVY